MTATRHRSLHRGSVWRSRPADPGTPAAIGVLAPGPNNEDQAEEAEQQRRAQQAIEAREADVFLQLANSSTTTTAASPSAPATGQPAADAKCLVLDPERDRNNQQRKLDLVNQRDTSGIYNPPELQAAASPYQVIAGSIIAASLIIGINSDLPGLVVAQMTENVSTGGTYQKPSHESHENPERRRKKCFKAVLGRPFKVCGSTNVWEGSIRPFTPPNIRAASDAKFPAQEPKKP